MESAAFDKLISQIFLAVNSCSDEKLLNIAAEAMDDRDETLKKLKQSQDKNKRLLDIYKRLKQMANESLDDYKALSAAVKSELKHSPGTAMRIFNSYSEKKREFKTDRRDWTEIYKTVKEIEDEWKTLANHSLKPC